MTNSDDPKRIEREHEETAISEVTSRTRHPRPSEPLGDVDRELVNRLTAFFQLPSDVI